ncbi:MAG: hypothetical protein EPN24_01860 [Candidatus Methanoperedens sp.]|nr:MAG: hypothetical protein EPN24_01860 [Candidatus Methanoperedens sp.]
MDAPRLTFSALSLVDHVALSPVGSGHITADKRFGSCRASIQIAFSNFVYPQTVISNRLSNEPFGAGRIQLKQPDIENDQSRLFTSISFASLGITLWTAPMKITLILEPASSQP